MKRVGVFISLLGSTVATSSIVAFTAPIFRYGMATVTNGFTHADCWVQPMVGAMWTLPLSSHGARLVLTPKAHLASHQSLCPSGDFLS